MQNISTLWSEAKNIIKTRVGDVAFSTWFGSIKIKEDKSDCLMLEVPDNFFKEWFIDHYLELIDSVIKTLTDEKISIELIVNPAIIKREGSSVEEEGCLSVAGLQVKVRRAKRITVTFLSEKGEVSRLSADGLFSRAIQHEIDHLSGRLIVDYLNPIRRLLACRGLRRKRT